MTDWLPKQKVVVPVDFSLPSLAAVDTALTLVEGASHIYLLHVLPVLAPAEPGMIWDTVDDESRVHHAKQAMAEKFSAAKYAGIHVESAVDDPGHEIAAFAERVGADLIVIPSHGRTGLTRLLLGSVAERVTRLAHCPVLVLKQSSSPDQ